MYLGIDIGTSGAKAVITAEEGRVLGQAAAPLSVSRPHDLWAEQDPEDWWRATGEAVRSLDAELRRSVRGVGLAGQMHGATLLGADDRVLRPAILWNDGRSFAECRELEAATPRLHEIAGNIAMPGFTAPKLLWVRKHEPEVFAATAKVLLPKDFVRLKMTGDHASDLSDSAGTLWLDVANRCWSEELLAACDLELEHMPTLFEGLAPTGRLRREVAESWGMGQVPVAAGGGDNAAGAAGVGVVKDGDGLLSLGTSGVIFVATDTFRPNPASAVHAFCHCLPGMWHQMAVHLNAASCVDWGARALGAAGPAEVFELAQNAEPAQGRELFLPYLSGERTPHNDPHVRGAFLNLDNGTDRGRLVSAVLEGVAFTLADGLDALRQAGTEVESLAVIGGGARSAYWGTILAAALRVRLIYLEGGETGPALGAARLAQAAVSGAMPEEIFTRPAVAHVIEPEPELAERLVPRLERFRAAYPLVSQIQE